MKTAAIFIINLLVFISVSFDQATGPGAQNEEKVKKLKFCGYKYKDSSLLRKHFEQQLAFLQVHDGDTIVDVGTSIGALIGAIKGASFNNGISFVLNTTDSLYLPLNSKQKLWIFNTLHEIPGKANITRQMAAVLQSGGELIIAELMATEKKKDT